MSLIYSIFLACLITWRTCYASPGRIGNASFNRINWQLDPGKDRVRNITLLKRSVRVQMLGWRYKIRKRKKKTGKGRLESAKERQKGAAEEERRGKLMGKR